jgi:AcrR family transcriptional regulator
MSRAKSIVRAARPRPPVQAVDSRQRIHRVALQLFARYGYEGVSLQQIADEVGLHKSSLFHHYRNKLELRNEIMEAVLEDVLACVRPLVEAEVSIDTFLEGFDRLVDHFSEQPEAARLLVSAMSAPDDSDLRRGRATDRVLEFYVSLAGWLERARRLGVVRPLNIRQAIPNLIGLVLFYPAVAGDLSELVGTDPFAPRAREIRKQELRILVRALLEPR